MVHSIITKMLDVSCSHPAASSKNQNLKSEFQVGSIWEVLWTASFQFSTATVFINTEWKLRIKLFIIPIFCFLFFCGVHQSYRQYCATAPLHTCLTFCLPWIHVQNWFWRSALRTATDVLLFQNWDVVTSIIHVHSLPQIPTYKLKSTILKAS